MCCGLSVTEDVVVRNITLEGCSVQLLINEPIVVYNTTELWYDLRSRLVAWVGPELSRGPPLDELPYEKPRFFELH